MCSSVQIVSKDERNICVSDFTKKGKLKNQPSIASKVDAVSIQ